MATKKDEKSGADVERQVQEGNGQVVPAGSAGAVAELSADDELAQYSGQGSEHVRAEDMATPFLMVLQDNSPECKRSEAKFVPGAVGGMFMHSVTKQLFDGRLGLEVVDCYFEPLYIKWKPRADKAQGRTVTSGGGNFHGAFGPGDPVLETLLKQAKPDPRNSLRLILPDGDDLVDVKQHYLLVRQITSYELKDLGGGMTVPSYTTGNETMQPAVLGLASTQIKKSRDLNAAINLEKVRDGGGALVPIPRFGVVWRLTTVPEKNDQGSWFGVRFERLRRVDREQLALARAFHAALAAGRGRARPDEAQLEREDASAATNQGGGPAGGPGGAHPVNEKIPY